MRTFENQTFEMFDDRDSGAVFSDLEFRRCRFEDCIISLTHEPRLRSTVRNVRLINCTENAAKLKAAIIEDVVVDGLRTTGLLQTWGAVFKHVVLRGKVGRVMISNNVLGSPFVAEFARQKEIETFRQANAEYYRNVDWALDISEGEFKELCIRGVPAELVRRDPETQAVVTRVKAIEGRWKEPDLAGNEWRISIELLLERGDASVVLVAPKRHRKFKAYVEDLEVLRKAGVAEPD